MNADSNRQRQRQLHQHTSGVRPLSAGRGKRVDGIGAEEMNVALSAALARFARGEFVHGPRGTGLGGHVQSQGGEYAEDMVMLSDDGDGGEG